MYVKTDEMNTDVMITIQNNWDVNQLYLASYDEREMMFKKIALLEGVRLPGDKPVEPSDPRPEKTHKLYTLNSMYFKDREDLNKVRDLILELAYDVDDYNDRTDIKPYNANSWRMSESELMYYTTEEKQSNKVAKELYDAEKKQYDEDISVWKENKKGYDNVLVTCNLYVHYINCGYDLVGKAVSKLENTYIPVNDNVQTAVEFFEKLEIGYWTELDEIDTGLQLDGYFRDMLDTRIKEMTEDKA